MESEKLIGEILQFYLNSNKRVKKIVLPIYLYKIFKPGRYNKLRADGIGYRTKYGFVSVIRGKNLEVICG